MAFIEYASLGTIPSSDRVNDDDNIIQIHSVHPRVMKLHHELYIELMHRASPLSRIERELVAVVASSINACHY